MYDQLIQCGAVSVAFAQGVAESYSVVGYCLFLRPIMADAAAAAAAGVAAAAAAAAAVAAAAGAADDYHDEGNLARRIREKKAEAGEYRRMKAQSTKELRNLNKRKRRLMSRARELDDNDLQELFVMRAAAKAKAKAAAKAAV